MLQKSHALNARTDILSLLEVVDPELRIKIEQQ